MKFYSTLGLLALGAMPLLAQADVEHGQKLFLQSCASCHGKQAEKPALGQSAIVNQLEMEEVIEALQDRKSGKIRGAGNSAKSRLSDEDMKDIGEFIKSLQ